MKAKITKRTVDAARPARRVAFIWDTELTGFGLKVTPSGNRIYVLQYRIGGRLRRYTIGNHGSPWTPADARTEASRLRGLIAAGIDPAEEKAEARADPTIMELCELYVTEGCATKKPSTLIRDRSRIERHIKPLLGRKRLGAVTRADVERFQRDVAAGKTATDAKTGFRGRAIVSGGEGAARECVVLLGSIFSFAVNRGLRTENPVRGVKKFKTRKLERFLSPPELARLGEALTVAEQAGESPVAAAAVRLLMLTGARKSEILGLRWEWIDFERGCLRLPDSKTGAKAIPLGAPALELLASLPRIEGNPHVLPGDKPERHLVGLQKAWERIRKRAGLEDVRLHDLRHSFASVAVAGGDSLYLVGKLLGHQQSRTTERYAHLADDPLRAVADRTSGVIAAAMNGKPGGGAEVVDLPKRKA
jgi:integrase